MNRKKILKPLFGMIALTIIILIILFGLIVSGTPSETAIAVDGAPPISDVTTAVTPATPATAAPVSQ